jgi:hypothetical protein
MTADTAPIITVIETALAPDTPTQIAPSCPDITKLIVANTGAGALTLKFGSAPTSATDGLRIVTDTGSRPLTLDPMGRITSDVIRPGDAWTKAVFAWSSEGTTVEVRQEVHGQ